MMWMKISLICLAAVSIMLTTMLASVSGRLRVAEARVQRLLDRVHKLENPEPAKGAPFSPRIGFQGVIDPDGNPVRGRPDYRFRWTRGPGDRGPREEYEFDRYVAPDVERNPNKDLAVSFPEERP